MKDWTEGVLAMFTKHNEDISLVRKKCKFLERFDESYFTADVYKDR